MCSLGQLALIDGPGTLVLNQILLLSQSPFPSMRLVRVCLYTKQWFTCAVPTDRMGSGVVGPPLWSPLYPEKTDGSWMDRFFNKERKRSPEPPQQDLFLGIPTNMAAGPLGFRAELNISPTGEQNRSCHDSEKMGLIRLWRKVARTTEVRAFADRISRQET